MAEGSTAQSETFFSRVSRRLILVASAWLLGSWAINLAIDAPVRLNSETILPAVRWMLMSTVLGLHVAWPLWRLSHGRQARPFSLVWIDMLCMVLVFQVVIWPLRLLVGWPVALAGLINVVVVAWMLGVGLCVYVGLRSGSTAVRCAALVLSLALMAAGPAAALIAADPALTAMNPFSMLWSISGPVVSSEAAVTVVHGARTMLIAALVGWIAAVAAEKWRGVDGR